VSEEKKFTANQVGKKEKSKLATLAVAMNYFLASPSKVSITEEKWDEMKKVTITKRTYETCSVCLYESWLTIFIAIGRS